MSNRDLTHDAFLGGRIRVWQPARGYRAGTDPVLLAAAVLLGLGTWGVLSQQSFVMIMMGFELAINGIMLAAAGVWRFTSGGEPRGQVLVIVAMLVMAVEAAIGFALVVAVYRARQQDTTEGIAELSR